MPPKLKDGIANEIARILESLDTLVQGEDRFHIQFCTTIPRSGKIRVTQESLSQTGLSLSQVATAS